MTEAVHHPRREPHSVYTTNMALHSPHLHCIIVTMGGHAACVAAAQCGWYLLSGSGCSTGGGMDFWQHVSMVLWYT